MLAAKSKHIALAANPAKKCRIFSIAEKMNILSEVDTHIGTHVGLASLTNLE